MMPRLQSGCLSAWTLTVAESLLALICHHPLPRAGALLFGCKMATREDWQYSSMCLWSVIAGTYISLIPRKSNPGLPLASKPWVRCGSSGR